MSLCILAMIHLAEDVYAERALFTKIVNVNKSVEMESLIAMLVMMKIL